MRSERFFAVVAWALVGCSTGVLDVSTEGWVASQAEGVAYYAAWAPQIYHPECPDAAELATLTSFRGATGGHALTTGDGAGGDHCDGGGHVSQATGDFYREVRCEALREELRITRFGAGLNLWAAVDYVDGPSCRYFGTLVPVP